MSRKIGDVVREVFEQRGMKLYVLANRLGTVRQNVYKIFQKSSIQTSTLGKLGEILEYDFFRHLRQDGSVMGNPSSRALEVDPPVSGNCAKDLEESRRHIAQLEERLRDKETIIRLLQERLKH